MLETSARLLRLLSLLQVRPEWAGADLAGRLGGAVTGPAPWPAPEGRAGQRADRVSAWPCRRRGESPRGCPA
jgi:hypothetical protein